MEIEQYIIVKGNIEKLRDYSRDRMVEELAKIKEVKDIRDDMFELPLRYLESTKRFNEFLEVMNKQ